MYETPYLNDDNQETPYYTVRKSDASSVCDCLKLAGVKVTVHDDDLRTGEPENVEEIVILKIAKNDVLAARAAMRDWNSRSTPS